MSNDRIYYNFVVQNDNDNKLVLDQTDYRNQDLIQNPEDWSLSVLKFNLPTEAIESFNIQDSNNYQITLSSSMTDNLDVLYGKLKDYSVTVSMPNSNSFKYITYEDVVESFNRTCLECHRNLLASSNSDANNVVNKSGTYSIALTTNPYIHERTINIDGTAVPFGNGNFAENYIGYIKIGLKMGYPSVLYPNTLPVRVYIVDPNGVKCELCAGMSVSSNNWLYFEDASFTSLDSKILDNGGVIPSGVFQPKESFIKLNTRDNQTGNWKLRIESMNTLNAPGWISFGLDVEYDINFYFMPKGKFNTISFNQFAPALKLDDTTKKLELLLHESYFYNNNCIYFSPKLYNTLGFSGTLMNGKYKLNNPQVLLSPTILPTSFITYTQPVSTLYKLTSIKSIQIRSNNLPIIGEYSIASQTNIIMSIDTTVDSNKDRYEFQTSLNRWYDLVGNAPISNVNFSVWIEYENDSVIQGYIPPFSKFTMLVLFCRKEKTAN